MGSLRYSTRAGSPPPPCYRSQCCWSNLPAGISVGPSAHLSWISPVTNRAINSIDIISTNRLNTTTEATVNLSQSHAYTASASSLNVREASYNCLLRGRFRRCALVKPQIYSRFYGQEPKSYEEDDILNNLDRFPRFRFGGNRTNNQNNRIRELERERIRERLKKTQPVPPPRTKRSTPPASPSKPLSPSDEFLSQRVPPLRSASFSQVDYSTDSKKYVRKTDSQNQSSLNNNLYDRGITTLPRSKNQFRFRIQDDSGTDNQNELPENTKEEPKKNLLNIPGNSRLYPNTTEERKFKLKRRKGIYLSKWPTPFLPSQENIAQFSEQRELDSMEPSNLPDIAKIQITEDKSNEFIWSSPQEEPLSPEESLIAPEWPSRSRSSQNRFERNNSSDSQSKASLHRLDSFSEDEDRKSDQLSLIHSDVSDYDGKQTDARNLPRPYSKKPLRGPYGQMLEAEMQKPDAAMKNQYDFNFLSDMPSPSRSSSMRLSKELQPRHSKNTSSARSYDENSLKDSYNIGPQIAMPKRKVSADSLVSQQEEVLKYNHQRTTSSPSKLETFMNSEASKFLLEHLLQGSSEQLAVLESRAPLLNDTRTHVVIELYDNERIYVESLQILTTKYLEPLKSSENASLLDSTLVDEIFDQIPFLLNHHQYFLEEFKKRLELWDSKQKIGDIFLEMFSKTQLIDSYANYVNNWKRARDIIKTTQQTKATFAKFLETTARDNKGKLTLDALLIKPIQKFPKYELLIQRLIKHTDTNHPDHSLLKAAQKELHEQILKINCTERETLEHEQLREIEGLIEGLIDLVTLDRSYIRYDLVTMASGSGTRKERALFLFSDLLLVSSIKKRNATIRKPTPTNDKSVTSALDANKYKLLMKISLEDLEVVKSKDENVRQRLLELDNVNDDIAVLNQINELTWSLHCNHAHLAETIKDMLASLNRQMVEQQGQDTQLAYLDLNLKTSNGVETLSLMFSSTEKRASWEDSFNDTKNKLVLTGMKKPPPKLLATVPIRKTRAGLQFTCAAPTQGDNGKDVWVCNSDGYVGQVCVLSFQPEPTVTSCNGVCNAKILCIASIPAYSGGGTPVTNRVYPKDIDIKKDAKIIEFDSSSSSEDEKSDEESDDPIPNVSNQGDSADTSSVEMDDYDALHSTMWLGTEDGCIHVYNSSDNIRIKKNKIKIQHNSPVLCIVYLEKRVFVSLANGDLIIYDRDSYGGWNVETPTIITIGCLSSPVAKMIANDSRIWCSCGNTIKILNTQTLATENTFTINNDNNKAVSCLVLSGNYAWISLQNTATVKCYNASSFEFVLEVNVAPSVTKMLTSCDDIIRQHKAACLRITSLLACKDLLWIGTSAGVLLTMPLPTSAFPTTVPTVTGVSQGHTGHVRFITFLEIPCNPSETLLHRHKRLQEQRSLSKMLVISGGDGYEDFRSSNISEVAGREDATNHLLLWSV